MKDIEAIRWQGDHLSLLDQRLLPHSVTYLDLNDAAAVTQAIGDLVVRGAPAIGITAAWGVVLSAKEHVGDHRWQVLITEDIKLLRGARPTAVNLGWALDRMMAAMANVTQDEVVEVASKTACEIQHADIVSNRAMGDFGAELISPGSQVLTHCNAGALATGGYGTALGVIRSGFRNECIEKVYAGETRPWLQGARLTAWELLQDQIPVTLVAEGAVAHLMSTQCIDWLIVGADRIAANGDVANKVGTYSAALHARTHGTRVMVVAPLSTIDRQTATGQQIPIEMRSADELLRLQGVPVAAVGAEAWNPVFDITPAHLIDAIVTDRGVALPPYESSLQALFQQ